MKLLFMFFMLAVIAQVPSCNGDQATTVVGYVEETYAIPEREGGPAVPWIVVGGRDYRVDWNFYRQVGVGDLVKYENGRWVIIRKYRP